MESVGGPLEDFYGCGDLPAFGHTSAAGGENGGTSAVLEREETCRGTLVMLGEVW